MGRDKDFTVGSLDTTSLTLGGTAGPSGTAGTLVTASAAEINSACDGVVTGSATWDPGSIASGAEEAKEVTVTGAVLGDYVICSFSLDVTDLVLRGAVTAADTVTVILANNTGGAIDLGSGTVRAKVTPQ